MEEVRGPGTTRRTGQGRKGCDRSQTGSVDVRDTGKLIVEKGRSGVSVRVVPSLVQKKLGDTQGSRNESRSKFLKEKKKF